MGGRGDPLSLTSSNPAPRLFVSLGFPPGSWIFFPPLCGAIHQKLIDTSAQDKGLLFMMSRRLSLRNGLTSGNSLFKSHYYLTESCLHPLIWCEEQKLSQTRAGQWPLMRQGHRAWKLCQEGTSILRSNQSGPIRPSFGKLGCKSHSQLAAAVETAGVTASKPRDITRRGSEQKPEILEGTSRQICEVRKRQENL